MLTSSLTLRLEIELIANDCWTSGSVTRADSPVRSNVCFWDPAGACSTTDFGRVADGQFGGRQQTDRFSPNKHEGCRSSIPILRSEVLRTSVGRLLDRLRHASRLFLNPEADVLFLQEALEAIQNCGEQRSVRRAWRSFCHWFPGRAGFFQCTNFNHPIRDVLYLASNFHDRLPRAKCRSPGSWHTFPIRTTTSRRSSTGWRDRHFVLEL